ncbi:hypothetical protein [Rubritalea marina]|uniref:hypothetical protein n=1 Tax=Rubritalea marina TaxID=361055 RepID=UPI001969BEB3|nr:hypothetical protein [Rubritalea marina]
MRLLILTALSASLASCNTFNGMGNDIKTFGSGVANSAQGKPWYGEDHAPTPNPAPANNQMAPTQVPQTQIPQQ